MYSKLDLIGDEVKKCGLNVPCSCFQSLSPLKHFAVMLCMLQMADWCWRHSWSTSLHAGLEPIDFAASRMTIDSIYLSEVPNDTWDQHDFCQTDWTEHALLIWYSHLIPSDLQAEVEIGVPEGALPIFLTEYQTQNLDLN